jgi:hypothetical protein
MMVTLFFDDGLLLVPARFARLLRRLVFVLAVVHDLADRRSCVWGYFDEVEIGVRGDAECVFDAHDPYLLPSWSNQTDFRYADALVDAGLSADGASLVGFQSRSSPRRNQSWKATPSAKRPCIAGPDADRSQLERVKPHRAMRRTGMLGCL